MSHKLSLFRTDYLSDNAYLNFRQHPTHPMLPRATTLTWHGAAEHERHVFAVLFAGAEDQAGFLRNHFGN